MRLLVRFMLVTSAAAGPLVAQQSLAVGSPLVKPERLARATERYEIATASGGQEQVVGSYVVAIQETSGYLLVTQETRLGPMVIVDSAWTNPATLVPSRQVSYGPAGRSELRFSASRVSGSRQGPNGDPVAVSVETPAPVFSGSLGQLMLRTLPLSDGFVATFPIYLDPIGMLEARVEVLGREAPAGTADPARMVVIPKLRCWRRSAMLVSSS